MRIAIANSNQLVSRGLRALCHEMDAKHDISLFSSYSDISKSEAEPDLIMVDFSTEGFGLDSLPRLTKKFPNTRLLAITPLQSANTVLNAIKGGVHGYVKTDCSLKEIQASVTEVGNGKKFFCGDILRVLQASGIDIDAMGMDELNCEPVLLTERETEILRYIATGHTNAEVADVLFLSGHTITTHRKNIMSKIGAKNTAEAVLYAVKEGVVDPDSISF